MEKEVLSNRQHTVASSIHNLPLIFREKERPLLYPESRPSYNLQKICSLLSVKNKIIPTCPYRPTYSRYANPYPVLIQLFNSI
jgi:hypothetical protein